MEVAPARVERWRRVPLCARSKYRSGSAASRNTWQSNLMPLDLDLLSSSFALNARFWHSMAPARISSGETPVRMLPSFRLVQNRMEAGNPLANLR